MRTSVSCLAISSARICQESVSVTRMLSQTHKRLIKIAAVQTIKRCFSPILRESQKGFIRTLRDEEVVEYKMERNPSCSKGMISISMIFNPFASLHLEELPITEEGITLLASLTTERGICPDCQTPSIRVHSRYQRRLQDLPSSGLSVQMRLQVRRFFCDNPMCSRKTFAEAPSDLAGRSARKTVRLIDTLKQLGFALGGEQGARIASVLKIDCSADTFLRLIRKTSLTTHATPTHLGVDDWAFHRNVSYGTILVDLQDHHVIDLLPDRAATTLETWLVAHPGVQLMSRDRAGEYATGARKGAPDAVQVADRFHMQKNLGEAVERIFQRHREAL